MYYINILSNILTFTLVISIYSTSIRMDPVDYINNLTAGNEQFTSVDEALTFMMAIKRKIIFIALRINKKFTFYCDNFSIETKKSQLNTPPHSTHFRYRCTIMCLVVFDIKNIDDMVRL